MNRKTIIVDLNKCENKLIDVMDIANGFGGLNKTDEYVARDKARIDGKASQSISLLMRGGQFRYFMVFENKPIEVVHMWDHALVLLEHLLELKAEAKSI
jgi:hypothetical protein